MRYAMPMAAMPQKIMPQAKRKQAPSAARPPMIVLEFLFITIP